MIYMMITEKQDQVTHEVFEDVNLVFAIMVLLLLQIMQETMNVRFCTC